MFWIPFRIGPTPPTSPISERRLLTNHNLGVEACTSSVRSLDCELEQTGKHEMCHHLNTSRFGISGYNADDRTDPTASIGKGLRPQSSF